MTNTNNTVNMSHRHTYVLTNGKTISNDTASWIPFCSSYDHQPFPDNTLHVTTIPLQLHIHRNTCRDYSREEGQRGTFPPLEIILSPLS